MHVMVATDGSLDAKKTAELPSIAPRKPPVDRFPIGQATTPSCPNT